MGRVKRRAPLRFTLRWCVAALQAWENEGVAAGWLDIDILNTDPRNVNRGLLSGNNLMFIRPENCRAQENCRVPTDLVNAPDP